MSVIPDVLVLRGGDFFFLWYLFSTAFSEEICGDDQQADQKSSRAAEQEKGGLVLTGEVERYSLGFGAVGGFIIAIAA